jgi:hypothetical protein
MRIRNQMTTSAIQSNPATDIQVHPSALIHYHIKTITDTFVLSFSS